MPFSRGRPPHQLQFRARLSNQLDLKHPLIRLAGLVDWEGFGCCITRPSGVLASRRG
jgi:hypothetical protein